MTMVNFPHARNALKTKVGRLQIHVESLKLGRRLSTVLTSYLVSKPFNQQVNQIMASLLTNKPRV